MVLSSYKRLNHTGGLQDYLVKNDSLEFWLHDPVENQDIMKEIIRQGVAFQPGDSLSYSNSAYYLLARILEQKNHKAFKQLVAENIANSYRTCKKKPNNFFWVTLPE